MDFSEIVSGIAKQLPDGYDLESRTDAGCKYRGSKLIVTNAGDRYLISIRYELGINASVIPLNGGPTDKLENGIKEIILKLEGKK